MHDIYIYIYMVDIINLLRIAVETGDKLKLSNVQLTVMYSDLRYRNNTVLRVLGIRSSWIFDFFFFTTRRNVTKNIETGTINFKTFENRSSYHSNAYIRDAILTLRCSRPIANSHWEDFAKQITTNSHHRDDYERG